MGDILSEDNQFVAFGKLASDGKGKPQHEGSAPFDAFLPKAVEVFALRNLLGAVALADADAVGEALEIVVGEFTVGDDVVEDGSWEVVELHPTGGHLVEEVLLLGAYEAVALSP